jgi:general secretion pathway protein I
MVFEQSRGFTLVEVMVALVIVAVALPALMISVYRQVDGVGYLRDKSIAGWVAANEMTEARLLVRGSRVLDEGKDSGVVEMASREWFWWSTREKTAQENILRLTITVGSEEADEKEPLVTLVGLLAPEFPNITRVGASGNGQQGSGPTNPQSETSGSASGTGS